ncbi:MAG: hypothetical protein A2X49_10535 [Lentisphaerae bacterium GWF2_52_8]|nr:MAG: hypothetical protein A2X49_10535 [Lentisphaerae bacterium GWF2_52_8]
MKKKQAKRFSKGERGEAIVESMMCLLLICLILFGLLQMFYLSVAQMLTDYSSFCTARSYAVGFAEYLVDRAARVAAIGASGPMVEDQDYNGSMLSQFAVETSRIPEYISGERWLEYEYWYGEGESNTTLSAGTSLEGGNVILSEVRFNDYPLEMPMRAAYTSSDSTNISGHAGMMNYAGIFLDTGED